jgi:hypothetical protein
MLGLGAPGSGQGPVNVPCKNNNAIRTAYISVGRGS